MTDPRRVSRRGFLASGAALAAGAACPDGLAAQDSDPAKPQPPAAETITGHTIAEAEKLAGLSFDEKERGMLLRGLRRGARGYRRRMESQLANGLSPATVFDPRAFGVKPRQEKAVRSDTDPGPLPAPKLGLPKSGWGQEPSWARAEDGIRTTCEATKSWVMPCFMLMALPHSLMASF